MSDTVLIQLTCVIQILSSCTLNLVLLVDTSEITDGNAVVVVVVIYFT